MANNLTSLDKAKRIMGSLVRMPLKPHDEVQQGKPKGRPAKRRRGGGKKKASPKPAGPPRQRPPNPKPN